MNTVGQIRLKQTLRYTDYFWGPLSDIAGKPIAVVERNPKGDCLCVVPGKGLVDVDARDIEGDVERPPTVIITGVDFGDAETVIAALLEKKMTGVIIVDSATIADDPPSLRGVPDEEPACTTDPSPMNRAERRHGVKPDKPIRQKERR